MNTENTVQIRCAGGIEYEFTRKRVKNINLRIRTDGTAAVSAPLRAPVGTVDRFVAERAQWIAQARAKASKRLAEEEKPYRFTPQQALQLFTAVSNENFPLFADVLGGVRPLIKVRKMKTRWGVCVPARRQITFSLRLAEKPRAAVEYVVLHEYAHFVHADHSPAFWAVVAHFMPDYKQRRRLLLPDAGAQGNE